MTTYQLPEPVGYSGFGPRYNADQMHGAFADGAASRDAEIDALDIAIDEVFDELTDAHMNCAMADESVRVLAARLAELEKQTPVAWQYDWYADDGEGNSVVMTDWITSDYAEAHSPTMGCHNIRPLFAAPMATKPNQDRLTALNDVAALATVGATYPELMEYLQSEIATAEAAIKEQK